MFSWSGGCATQLAADLANFSNLLRIHLLCLAGVSGATQLAADLANFSNLLRIHLLCLAGVAGATQLAADLANFNISKVT